MKIPNAARAVIAEDKLCEYLLNLAHRKGGSKARMLQSMGYSVDNWPQLEAPIRASHLIAEVDCEKDNDYGKRYEIVALLPGITGRPMLFRSAWQIDTGTDYPRLITMYPE